MTYEPEPCIRCGSTIEREDLRHSLVEKMHYNCALAHLAEPRAEVATVGSRWKDLGLNQIVHCALLILDDPKADLAALEFARGTLAAAIDYLGALLEQAQPGITKNPFLHKEGD